MSDFEVMRSQILGKNEGPKTQAHCDRLRDLCTETVRSLRSAMGECTSVEHSLTRELTWTPPDQRQSYEAELEEILAEKYQIDKHIASVEVTKSEARRVQRSLSQERSTEKSKEQPRDPRPRPVSDRKRSFGSPSNSVTKTAGAGEVETTRYESPSLSKVERLIRLSELYSKGAMSGEEFATARLRIADE